MSTPVLSDELGDILESEIVITRVPCEGENRWEVIVVRNDVIHYLFRGTVLEVAKYVIARLK